MAKKKIRRATDDGFDGIRAAFGIPLSRRLDLSGMSAEVGRIGYAEEGLRLTFAINSPYDFNAEVKLSRADAEWLRDRLITELSDPRNANMPNGKR